MLHIEVELALYKNTPVPFYITSIFKTDVLVGVRIMCGMIKCETEARLDNYICCWSPGVARKVRT